MGRGAKPAQHDKRRLRTQVLDQLRTQQEEVRRRKSETIQRRLFRLAVFRRAKLVCCYVSLPYEVETWRLMTRMLETGKRVAVPVVQGDALALSELRDPERDLARGAFGVWEPVPKRRRPVAVDAVDLVLVPALAFDRAGHRVGHGHGYFDRLLARLPDRTPTIGLCFDFQLRDRLPIQPHDRAVQTVLSA